MIRKPEGGSQTGVGLEKEVNWGDNESGEILSMKMMIKASDTLRLVSESRHGESPCKLIKVEGKIFIEDIEDTKATQVNLQKGH